MQRQGCRLFPDKLYSVSTLSVISALAMAYYCILARQPLKGQMEMVAEQTLDTAASRDFTVHPEPTKRSTALQGVYSRHTIACSLPSIP